MGGGTSFYSSEGALEDDNLKARAYSCESENINALERLDTNQNVYFSES